MYIEKNNLNKYISFWLALMFWIVSLMIVVGGLTRLTDSGLSITQWQLFSGILPPFNDNDWENYFNLYKQIPEFKLQNYLMTLDEFKVIFWWEWGHRFLGRLIGIIFFVPLIYFYFKIGFNKTKSLFFIFFLICLQGFLGWYMVSSGLVDRIDVSHFRLSIHLIIAFIIISLILWNYLKLKIDININEKSIVAIQDGVRPLVSTHLIDILIAQTKEKTGVIPVVPVKNSIRKVKGLNSIFINRDDLYQVQTPQCFISSDIKDAYNQDFTKKFTDDAVVFEANGGKISTIPGEERNLKITTIEDLKIANVFMQ